MHVTSTLVAWVCISVLSIVGAILLLGVRIGTLGGHGVTSLVSICFILLPAVTGLVVVKKVLCGGMTIIGLM